MGQSYILRYAPAIFVVLWSTGWIAPKYAMPHAEPFTFLTLRFVIAAVLLAAICSVMSVSWPKDPKEIGHALVAGVLINAIYLIGVWWSIMNGLPVSISGVISALQPILTALLAPYLVDERITRNQWIGVALGFVGVAMVLSPALAQLPAGQLSTMMWPLAVNVIGMVGVTLGTFYQKRFVAGGDLRAVTALQCVGAALFLFPLALMLETMRIEWNMQVILTMAWVVLGMSIGAVGLLLLLIREGAVSKAAALIYLMPPLVALQAAVLFGERLSVVQLIGMAITATGVALVVKKAEG